jgi:hypothetical protein
MWWLIGGILVTAVLFQITRNWKSYGDYLIDDFGQRISAVAKENIPLARQLHWEEITILFQLASFGRPEGRVLPETRPIDMRLTMCAFASLEAMIEELVGKSPGPGAGSPEARQQAIIRAHRPLLGVIAIQKSLMQNSRLPRDDYTIGYLHGLSDAFGIHHGLDFIQRITLVVTTMRMFYGMNSAVEYYSSVWSGNENSPRVRASRIGKKDGVAFLESGQPPLGLCNSETFVTADSFASADANQQLGLASMPREPSLADAVEECREIVRQQIPPRVTPRLDSAFSRGYLLGVADGVCQVRGIGDVESIVVATGLFCGYFGDEQGVKLMNYTMQVGQRSASHQARLLGGQEAIDHHNAGRSPHALRDHLASKNSKRK